MYGPKKRGSRNAGRRSSIDDGSGMNRAASQPRIGSKKKKNTVKVAVRVRPMSKEEAKNPSDRPAIAVLDNLVMLQDPKDWSDKDDPLHRSREAKFQFDVALGPESTQEELYQKTAAPVVGKVLGGDHGTVFAYGATGSGKTYSMSGGETNPGVIPLTIADLFKEIDNIPKVTEIKVTAFYLEIYNEELRDLLNPNEDSSLQLREDPIKGITVAGITEYDMSSKEDVFRILKEGASHRATDSHLLNDASSRSHAVLQITVDQLKADNKAKPKPGMDMFAPRRQLLKSAHLTLIDLAGSERAKRVGTNKKMLREGAKINRSLLSLANCINALVSQKKGLHIPYRDSKLTRILKESLSGAGAHTVMIANVSCAGSQFDETRETLLYANRAKSIKISAADHRRMSSIVMAQNRNQYSQLEDMKEELRDLKITLSMTFQSNSKGGPPLPSLAEVSSEGQDLTTLSRQSSAVSVGGSASTSPVAKGKRSSVRVRRGAGPSDASTNEIQNTMSIANRIIANFQDRIELRRSIMESTDTDHITKAKIARRNTLLSDLQQQSNHSNLSHSVDIDKLTKERNALLAGLNDNAKYRDQLAEHYLELEKQGKELRAEVKATKFREERIQLLNLTLDKCGIELEKSELELQTKYYQNKIELQASEMREKDKEILYLKSMLKKNVIGFTPFALKSNPSMRVDRNSAGGISPRVDLARKLLSPRGSHHNKPPIHSGGGGGTPKASTDRSDIIHMLSPRASKRAPSPMLRAGSPHLHQLPPPSPLARIQSSPSSLKVRSSSPRLASRPGSRSSRSSEVMNTPERMKYRSLRSELTPRRMQAHHQQHNPAISGSQSRGPTPRSRSTLLSPVQKHLTPPREPKASTGGTPNSNFRNLRVQVSPQMVSIQAKPVSSAKLFMLTPNGKRARADSANSLDLEEEGRIITSSQSKPTTPKKGASGGGFPPTKPSSGSTGYTRPHSGRTNRNPLNNLANRISAQQGISISGKGLGGNSNDPNGHERTTKIYPLRTNSDSKIPQPKNRNNG